MLPPSPLPDLGLTLENLATVQQFHFGQKKKKKPRIFEYSADEACKNKRHEQ